MMEPKLCGKCLTQNAEHKSYLCMACHEEALAKYNVARANFAAKNLARKKLSADRNARRIELGIDGFRKRGAPELSLRNAAHAFTRAAVINGFLVDPKSCKCVDCGKQAECYDHRDYSKPMIVDPVCRPCNNSRGRGFMPPIVTFERQSLPRRRDWSIGA